MAGRRKSRRKRKKPTRKATGGIRWGKVAAIVGGSVVLLLVIGGFVGYFAIKSYLHSDKFRAMISEKTSDFFKAEGEYEVFDWTGTTAYSNTFKGEGYEEAKFSKVKAEGIEAEVNLGGAKRGVWELTRVNVQRLNLLINDERLKGKPPATGGSEGEPPPVGGRKSLFSGFIPKKIEIKKTFIAATNFDLVHPGGETMKGRGIELEITPTSTAGISRLAGKKGSLDISAAPKNLRKLNIADFTLQTRKDGMFVSNSSAEFADAAPGRVFATGQIKSGDTKMNLKLNGVPVSKLVSDEWKRKIGGSLKGDVELKSISETGGAGLAVSGKVSVVDASLQEMPVLERIDKMVSSTKFRRLLLSDLSVRFEKRGDRLRIDEFHLEAAGTVCVKGRLDYEASQLSGGKYMAGITPDTIRWMPEWKKKIVDQVFKMQRDSAFSIVFGDDEDATQPPEGYRWAVVMVDPAAKEPFSSDLRRQFIEAGGLAIWAELQGMSAKAIEVATDVAKAATDEGVNIFDVITGESRAVLFTEEGMLKLGTLLGTGDSDGRTSNGNGGLLRLPGALIEGGFNLLP